MLTDSSAPRVGAGAPQTAQRERDDLALLAGPPAEQLLRSVLAAEGVELDRWSTHQVHHRPGVGVTVGWDLTWRVRGVTGREYLLGTTAPSDPSPRPGVTTVRADDRTVTVWRHPADPALPGLVQATSAALLAPALGADPDDVALELVTYRPLRRAVLRVTTPTATTYVKVVRPHTAEGLHRRHEMLRAAGLPAARTTLLPDGVLLLEELPGSPLTARFAADGAAGVDPGEVLGLLDRLPTDALELPRRPAWSERVLHHAAGAAAAVPQHSGEIERLGGEIAELVAASDAGPVVPTHGDLHQQNLLMEGDHVVGLLDVDSVGPGHRVDDLACMLGHLSVLPALAPEVHHRVPAALPRWVTGFETGVDPVALRARAAAVALSLVAGAVREARGPADGALDLADAVGRLAAARSWLADARRLRGLS